MNTDLFDKYLLEKLFPFASFPTGDAAAWIPEARAIAASHKQVTMCQRKKSPHTEEWKRSWIVDVIVESSLKLQTLRSLVIWNNYLDFFIAIVNFHQKKHTSEAEVQAICDSNNSNEKEKNAYWKQLAL